MENNTLNIQNMSLFSLSDIEIAKYLDNNIDKQYLSKIDDDRLSNIIPYCKNIEIVLDGLGSRIRNVLNKIDIYFIRKIIIKNKKYYTYLDEANKNLLYSSSKYGNEYIGYYISNKNVFYSDELSFDVLSRINNSSNIIYVKNRKEEYLGICYIKNLIKKNDSLENHIKHNYPKLSADLHTSDFIRYNHKYYMPSYPIIEDNKLIGVLSNNALNDLLEFELVDDYFKLAGITQNKLTTDNEQLGRKLPWLFVSLFTNFGLAMMFSTFIDKIRQVPILGIYLALVLMLSYVVGFTSLGSSLCFLRKNNDHILSSFKAFYYELKKSLVIALLLSIISFVLIYFFLSFTRIDYFDTTYYNSDSLKFALDITLMIFSSVIVSSIISFSIPILINRVDCDYSIGSYILISGILNIVITSIFFLICYAFI